MTTSGPEKGEAAVPRQLPRLEKKGKHGVAWLGEWGTIHWKLCVCVSRGVQCMEYGVPARGPSDPCVWKVNIADTT